jgi:2-methylcitrate dehydratase PrpD
MSDHTTGEVSAAIAAFVAETTFDQLSADAVERAKRSVLDLLACDLLGLGSEAVGPAHRSVLRHSGRDDATIFFTGDRASARDAALVNGAYVHSTEMSETFTRALAHPGNAVIPAVLATAEREGASGREVVLGTALGYELLIRLGLAAGPNLVLSQGLHPPATLGAFGSTAATSKVFGFSVEQTAFALGIASCHIPSQMMVAMYDHASVKDLFQAYAASLGVFSTDLAAEGMTGPVAWLESWVKAVPRVFDATKITDRLGQHWYVSSGGLHFKLLPVMAMSAPTLGAIRSILAEHPELDNDAIDDILVESSGRIELNRIDYPENMVSARGALPFLVAASLQHRDAFLGDRYLLRFLEPQLLQDATVRDLSRKVRLEVDPEFDHNMEVAWPMKFEARVTIRLSDGGTIVGYHDTWPETSTMDYSGVADKFLAIAETKIDEGRASEIVAAVRELEKVDNVRELVTLLA